MAGGLQGEPRLVDDDVVDVAADIAADDSVVDHGGGGVVSTSDILAATATASAESARGLRRFALRHPRVSGWIVLILILGLSGTWAGPGWNPQPMPTLIVPERPNTAITTQWETAALGSYDVDVELTEVTLRDGVVIPAKIRRPVGFEGEAPGVLFVHGTGTDSHTNFEREAAALTSAGIVTIVPDKRTTDYTTTHRDYPALANDYEDVFEDLLARPGVNPRHSGIYAVSEGCFIAPIVAARNNNVRFVVLISAPVLPIREQGAMAADTYLRNLGAPERFIRAIPRLVGQDFGADTFTYIDFDVSQYQRQMNMPVLMLYGTGDMSMPTIQGPQILRDDLARNGNHDFTVRYYGGADHGLQVDGVLVSDAMRDTSDWVNGLPYTADARPHIAGQQPTQHYQAGSVEQPHWFASGPFAVWTFIVGFGLTLAGIVLTILGAIRIRSWRLWDFRGCGLTVSLASLAVILAWAAALAYVGAVAVLALSYQQNRLIVQGGWLAVQAIAFIAAWMVVRVPFAWHGAPYPKDGSQTHALSGLANVIVVVSFIGQLVLLFALAYWGFYPSIV